MCQHSPLPSSISPGSERRGFVSSVYQGAPWGPAAAGGSERHPRVPSAALGPCMGPPWQGPGQQWLPVMTATPSCLPPSWQPGDWGGGAASPPSVILQQALQASGSRVGHLLPPLRPSAPPTPPSSFSGLPLVPTHQEMGGELGEGGARAPLPRSGGGVCVPHTQGQPQTPLCSRVAGCLSITKELLFKS